MLAADVNDAHVAGDIEVMTSLKIRLRTSV
jgi:hypothetical protein